MATLRVPGIKLKTLPEGQDNESPYGPSPLDSKSLTADAKLALEQGHPDEAAYILLLCGGRAGEIARVCGYPDHAAMQKAVKRLRRQQTIESRAVRQWHEVQRLERLERALQPQIEAGNVEAVKTAAMLSEQRRQIMGDDEPKRVALPQLPPDAEMERITKHFKAISGVSLDVPSLMADFKEVAQKGGFLPAGAESLGEQEPEEAELVLEERDDA